MHPDTINLHVLTSYTGKLVGYITIISFPTSLLYMVI